MARVIFKKGTSESLPLTYAEGTIYITTDDHAIYLDTDDHTRVRVGGMAEAELEGKITELLGRELDDAITELDLDSKFDKKGAADAKDTAIAEAKQAGTDAQTAVDALEAKVGEVTPETTIVEMIEEAKTEASSANATLAGRVTANENALNTLKGDKEQKGSVAKQVADAVAEIVAKAPTDYDTLKEIADWITTHASSASAMNSTILEHTDSISALQTLVGSLPPESGASTIVEYIGKVKTEANAYADTLKLEWEEF